MLTAEDINNSDTTGYTKFQDTPFKQNVPVKIGEYSLEANIQKATWGGAPLYMVIYDDTTTAAREEGLFLFGVAGPSGKEDITHRITSYTAGASGQGSTPSEWYIMPEGAKYCPGGGKLFIYYSSYATDTMDTSDMLLYSLPCVVYV